MPENEKQIKDDANLSRPPIKTQPPEAGTEAEHAMKDRKISDASKAVKKNAVTLININQARDEGDFFAVYRRKKKAKRDVTEDELTKLHNEYPAVALAIQRYRSGREENPLPDQSSLKEKSIPPHKNIHTQVKRRFENETGHKKSLNHTLIAVTASLASISGVFKKLNEDSTALKGNADKYQRMQAYLTEVSFKFSHVLKYYEKAESAPDRHYQKELLRVKKIIENAITLTTAIYRRCYIKNGEIPPGVKQDNDSNADTLSNQLRNAQSFFVSEQDKKASGIQTRTGISSAVTGERSEKSKSLNLSRAKITESVITQFGDIIESEDEYETRLETYQSGKKPSVENIRAKYEALQKYLETFGIRPEHLITQNVTGRKSQMTILAKFIAF